MNQRKRRYIGQLEEGEEIIKKVNVLDLCRARK